MTRSHVRRLLSAIVLTYCRAGLVLLALLVFAAPAFAKPIISDLAQHRILIDSAFTGTDILLFGARNDIGDIILVVRGPSANITVRRKARYAGIWVNRDAERFESVPYYYFMASTLSMAEWARLTLPDNLDLRWGTQSHTIGATLPRDSLWQAFVREQQQEGLYRTEAQAVTFMGETLFKQIIPFPDSIPRGRYTAEIYLVENNRLVGMQSIPLVVEKRGMDAFMFDLAHNSPLLYGIMAIAVALAGGWAASVIFRKL